MRHAGRRGRRGGQSAGAEQRSGPGAPGEAPRTVLEGVHCGVHRHRLKNYLLYKRSAHTQAHPPQQTLPTDWFLYLSPTPRQPRHPAAAATVAAACRSAADSPAVRRLCGGGCAAAGAASWGVSQGGGGAAACGGYMQHMQHQLCSTRAQHAAHAAHAAPGGCGGPTAQSRVRSPQITAPPPALLQSAPPPPGPSARPGRPPSYRSYGTRPPEGAAEAAAAVALVASASPTSFGCTPSRGTAMSAAWCTSWVRTAVWPQNLVDEAWASELTWPRHARVVLGLAKAFEQPVPPRRAASLPPRREQRHVALCDGWR